MRVFVAGAAGAIGRRLTPLLVQAGHRVTGMTRSPQKAGLIRAAGATPVVVDALDAARVMQAVREAAPEAIIHELTSIPADLDVRHFDQAFALTNRLRTEGLDHLIAAGQKAGCRRFLAQSFAGWPYAREGGFVKTEEDPLDPDPPRALRSTLRAIRYLERAVTGIPQADGIVLRYGSLYGPGNTLGSGGALLQQVCQRRLPIVGGGTGVWSFLHIDDAAFATLRALDSAAPGIYNIVDNEPAPVSEWLSTLAAAVGAKPPLQISAWLGRLAIGEHGVILMTDVRGASNAKARRELSWKPRWSTWREGFWGGLSDDHAGGSPLIGSMTRARYA